jgi:hypothetical protein
VASEETRKPGLMVDTGMSLAVWRKLLEREEASGNGLFQDHRDVSPPVEAQLT